MKFNIALNNFTSGEWSPKMLYRSDVEQYVRACRHLKNFQVGQSGGAFRRSGFKYIPMSTAQTTLDASSGDVKTISWNDINGNPVVLICIGSNLSDWVFLRSDLTRGSIGGAGPFGGTPVSWEVVDGYLFMILTSNVSGGTFPVYFTYDGSSMNIYSFYPSSFSQRNRLPYSDIITGVGSETVTVTGVFTVGGAVSMVFSSWYSTNPLLTNQYIKLSDTSVTAWVQVTGYTGVSTLTGTVVGTTAIPGASPQVFGGNYTSSFQVPAWHRRINTTDAYGGVPTIVSSFQGRLIFSGFNVNDVSYLNRGAVFMSRIGDPFTFDEVPDVQDPSFTSYTEDNSRPAVLFPSLGNGSSRIVTMSSSSKNLFIFTDAGEILARGTQGALGPNDFIFEQSTQYGAKDVRPLRINNFLTFVEKSGRQLRDIVFNFDEDAYKSTNLSFTSTHLLDWPSNKFASIITQPELDEMEELALVRGESDIIYVRTKHGRLIGCTIDREQNTYSWFDCPLKPRAAISGLAQEDTVISIASIKPNVVTGGSFLGINPGDCLVAVIKRTQSSGVHYYVELLYQPNDLENMFGEEESGYQAYLDCWKGYDSNTGNVYSGFFHLRGETVTVIADGINLGEYVVNSSGQVTLDSDSYSSVIAGYSYESKLTPAPIEAGSQIGSSRDIIKRLDQITINTYLSYGGKIVNAQGREEIFANVDPNNPIGDGGNRLKLYSESIEIKPDNAYAKKAEFSIITDEPYPLNILSLSIRGVTYD